MSLNLVLVLWYEVNGYEHVLAIPLFSKQTRKL